MKWRTSPEIWCRNLGPSAEVFPDEDCTNTMKLYIPHHKVLTPEKTTTRLRIVFDASAKTRKKNENLNESLHHLPVILEDLCGTSADEEKALLQVGQQPDDRDVTWFLCLKDPSKPCLENNVQVLRFTIRYYIQSISIGWNNQESSNV